MSIEEAIRECSDHADRCEKTGCETSASDFRQIAGWLQELKERREKESRQIPQDMTEEACEALVKLSEKIIEILPDIVSSVTANIPEAIEQYIESKIRNGKEESK